MTKDTGRPLMTLRDYFAGQALVGIISCEDKHLTNSKEAADRAFRIADAFIAERNKS